MKLRNTFRTAAIAAVAVATTMTAACGGTGTSGSNAETVTVYSADGLATWYKAQFDKFTKDTGIGVNVVEAGSGEVVSRLEKEQSNPQADLLVTLPWLSDLLGNRLNFFDTVTWWDDVSHFAGARTAARTSCIPCTVRAEHRR